MFKGNFKDGLALFECYCGWFNFCGIPIFVAFVEDQMYEFQYSYEIAIFLYDFSRKIS